ncbi:MAG: hypothetical protein HY908_27285 [Myxococcales bacterium]|nr:hypothetical protein [Myxococcales bacterium]
MSKAPERSREHRPASDRARPDWKSSRPNPHAGKLVRDDNWRRLDDELASAFRTSKEVNDALRALLALRTLLPGAPARPRRRPAA